MKWEKKERGGKKKKSVAPGGNKNSQPHEFLLLLCCATTAATIRLYLVFYGKSFSATIIPKWFFYRNDRGRTRRAPVCRRTPGQLRTTQHNLPVDRRRFRVATSGSEVEDLSRLPGAHIGSGKINGLLLRTWRQALRTENSLNRPIKSNTKKLLLF